MMGEGREVPERPWETALKQEIQRRTAARRRRWGELLKEREAGRKSKRKCDICEALLDHPEVMDCGELCGVCAGKVQKMIPAEYSYEPEAVAWW